METWEMGRPGRLRAIVVFVCIGMAAACSVSAGMAQAQAAQQPAPNPATRPVGTIKTITGKTIVLTTDAGPEVEVQVQDDARLVRVEPGEKDLKNAVPLQLQDLQSGDRILVRGKIADDGKTVLAASVIAIKSADIATKQAHERDEWQRHGAGGLVKSVDAAAGAITISTNSLGVSKDVTVQVSKQTVLRRYATNSVKFDDAKPAPIDQIKVGDQLRARGSRNADGTQLTADEVVSGTFRNIAGTVSWIDASAGTITVMDLVAKKPVTVKVTADTQLRKLSPAIAQGIALRLKGGADAPAGTAGATPGSASPKPADAAAGGQTGSQGGQAGGAGGAGRAGGAAGAARGGDLGQMLSRMPAATLADLQKGDAVMIVTTEGTQEGGATAITLLAGVEPLLQASGASSILTPWTMSGAPGGDAAP
jgi:transcription antitermination factor NusG